MNLDTSKIVDIEIDGIDIHDWPDLCDSFISKASYPKVEHPRSGFSEDWRDLTDEEIEWLQENKREWYYDYIYSHAMDRFY